MNHIVLTCKIVTIQLCAAQLINHCRIFLSPLGKSHIVIPPQSFPFWYATDWFEVSFEHIFFIKTVIYRLQVF